MEESCAVSKEGMGHYSRRCWGERIIHPAERGEDSLIVCSRMIRSMDEDPLDTQPL